MCTAIAKQGKDLIYGFNLDIDPNIWDFKLYKTKNYFTVGITVGKTTYFTHGVNSSGQFGNVPYMNGNTFEPRRGAKRERIDIMIDRYIRGKYSFEDVKRIICEKEIVCKPETTLHSLVGNRNGEFLIIEPGYGSLKEEENYAVLSNFPILANLMDFSSPFYGKERYDKAVSVLKNSDDNFSVSDALALLNDVKQTGQWGTKISFVYSQNETAVYYCIDGDFSKIETHRMQRSK